MDPLPSGAGPAGFFLSLLTESFAVRAFLGSVVALTLAGLAMRRSWVRAPATRRAVVLAPLLAAAVGAVASVVEAEAYLPQLWIASSRATSGRVLELLGELRVIPADRGVDVLLVGWGLAVTVLLARRAWGAVATRALLAGAEEAPADHPLVAVVDRLRVAMGTPPVRVRLLAGCPGGALTTGVRRPVIVVDPALLTRLDAQEIEGLVAHEVAHVARRDSLVGVVVGIAGDVTFFLPTVHVVRRWLRREREESADELASARTGRPAALASSILKVWEGGAPHREPLNACAAVAGAALVRWVPTWAPRRSDGMRVVTSRVERLVTPASPRSAARRLAEVSLVAAVIAAASVAAVALPQWIVDDLDTSAVAIGYVPPPAQPVESPAFSTFRALAPAALDIAQLHGHERTYSAERPRTSEVASGCPCVESQAQWLGGVAAAGGDSDPMTWRSTSAPAWDADRSPESVRARPLLTLPDATSRVGFFVVAEPGSP